MAFVKIYSTTHCPYCKRAKAMFEQMGVEFEDINIENDPKLRDELIEKYNWQTVPMIVAGEKFLGGYDEVATLQVEGRLKSELGME